MGGEGGCAACKAGVIAPGKSLRPRGGAPLVVFLASDAATLITGPALSVSGGHTMA